MCQCNWAQTWLCSGVHHTRQAHGVCDCEKCIVNTEEEDDDDEEGEESEDQDSEEDREEHEDYDDQEANQDEEMSSF